MEFRLSDAQDNVGGNSRLFPITAMGAALMSFLLVRNRLAPRHVALGLLVA
jgi:hypothetical protein